VSPFLIFTSYARDDDNDVSPLGKVVEDLIERVRGKLGRKKTDQFAFFDTKSIATGEQWEERLGKAVREASLLVCMSSPTYLTREHCAKEFDVFSRRLSVENEAADARAVVLVIWDVVDDMPASLLRFQHAHESLPKKYLQNGLLALRRVKSAEDDYNLTIDALAQAIKEALKRPPLAPLSNPPAFTELADWFHNPGPSGVAVTIVHDEGASWRIGHPGDPLPLFVDGAVRRMKARWRLVPSRPAGIMELRKLSAAGEPCIVIMDEASALKSPGRDFIAHIADGSIKNAGLLVGRAEKVAGERAISAAMVGHPTFRSADSFLEKDATDFKARFEQLATSLRMSAIADGPAKRVEDPQLEKAAAAAGIPISSKPSVIGPGGAQP
jgi:hypothetical protein